MKFKAKVFIEVDIEENDNSVTVEEAESALGCEFGSSKHEEYAKENFEKLLRREMMGSIKNVKVELKEVMAYDEQIITIKPNK